MLSEIDETFEVTVTVTVTPTIEDYRGIAYKGGVFTWNAALFGLLAAGAVLSWAAGQVIGAIILGGTAILLLSYTYISLNRQLRRLPGWLLAPHTFHLTREGLAVSNPAGDHLFRWGAFSTTRKDPLAYWFLGPGNTRVPLSRRALRADQEASIEAALAQFGDRIGETL